MFNMNNRVAPEAKAPDFERDMITISRAEFEYLQYCERKLDTLMDCGVEAWPHYLQAKGLLADRESRRPVDISRPRWPIFPKSA